MRAFILPVLLVICITSSWGRQCTEPPPGAVIVKTHYQRRWGVVFVYPGTYVGQVNVSRAGPVTIMGYTKNTLDFAHNTVTLVHNASLATGAGSDDLTGTLRVLSNNVSPVQPRCAERLWCGVLEWAGHCAKHQGDHVGVYACRLFSYQDTLYTNVGNHVYLKSYIEGAVDFIFGRHSIAYFEGNTIASKGAGCITASGRQLNDNRHLSGGLNATADVFNENKIIAATDAFPNVTGNVFLGRPWGDFARVVFKNTYIPAPLNKTIWSIWNPGDERTDFILFTEYNSFGPGVAHAHRANFSTGLTREEAAQYTLASAGARLRRAQVLGGWDLGVCVSLFLQGVLCAQFAHYTCLNKRNSVWIKPFVAGLMTTLRSLQSLALIWIQNVATFGSLEAGSNLLHTHWLSQTTLTLEAATAFSVQMFFCRRLWAISRNAYLVTLYCIGATKSRNNRPSTYSLLRWTRRLEYVLTIGMDH
ncbi:pectin lyase fold/virulence factor [Mycena olivaceomarginata]|nr:pectin lyase fold/virulence factor [Mycena olivaceomarginata]